MAFYHRKPEIYEAVQFTSLLDADDIINSSLLDGAGAELINEQIVFLEAYQANVGDYIVRGYDGFHVIDSSSFPATFESIPTV